MNSRLRPMFNLALPLLGLLISLGGVVLLQLPRTNEDTLLLTKEQAQKEEQQKQLRLNLLKKLPSFGYQNLLADWILLDFIQYYGDRPSRDLTGNSLSGDYFETLVNKDPRFVGAYFLLSPATSLFGGEPIRSVALMNQGLKYMNPNLDSAYQVWLYKAIDETLFLGDYQTAKNSYITGADWARYHDTEAARIAENRARDTAAFLATNPDGKLVQASAWVMVYSNAKDDQTRELAVKEIKKLGAQVVITPTSIGVRMPETVEKKKSDE